ncbi:ribonuclease T2 family protein [Mangrovicoccus algicola]|uniref:Ribonuclease T n=1 Tax=Mangrovicoccus algicola TaxID=2771008 RepID=A0A8J6ZDS4_9RHOB|nr:ribonuclease T [Mangrovicoccus algicola]MBE3640076.1 ribonuclease T [Mangrovicoccus algicola]
MLRWIAALLVLAGTAGAAESTDNLLALSWQPAFCEMQRGSPRPECRALEDGKLPWTESGFTLHGLWPQPRDRAYCGVTREEERADRAGDWDRLPRIALDRETATQLIRLMPGVRSQLERHEWTKYGSCYGDAAGQLGYFRDALWLTREINAALGPLMAGRLDRPARLDEMRRALDDAFGRGAGNALELVCRRDGPDWLISEIRLHLRGEINPARPLAPLLRRDHPVPSDCESGLVDAAGPG